jgi:AraC-like DNA-binding protein/quercetin dioxygenase-like cupin family protein
MAEQTHETVVRLDSNAQLATYRGGGVDADHPASAYCSTWVHPRPGPLDPHFHAGMEFGIVLVGEEEIHMGGVVLRCGPGDAWLCGMGQKHSWRVTVAGTINVVFIFMPRFLGEEELADPLYLGLLGTAPEHRPATSTPGLRERLLAIGLDTRRELLERPPRWETMLRLNLLRALNELMRAYDIQLWEQPSLPRTRRNSAVQVMPAVELVHQCRNRRVSASEAAARCSLSLSRFQHLFKDAMGVSFGQFSIQVRLSATADLILYTEQPLRAIAEEAGFVDLSHFSRAFRKHYGCAPRQYRDVR